MIGETFMETGKKEQAAEVIRQILLLNPSNADEYKQVLQQIQSE